MTAFWIVLAIVVALLAGWAGRKAARWLRLPSVIGEICVGLVLGPAVIALTGWRGSGTPMDGIRTVLTLAGKGAVILYLTCLVQDLRASLSSKHRAETARVTTASVLVSFATGIALAGIVVLDGSPALRGTAPSGAFTLYLAIAMGVTAVPVLARIITERGMTGTKVGSLSLTAAIVTDALAWLLLAVALGLNSGRPGGFLVAAATAAGGAVLAWGGRSATARWSSWSGRHPRLATASVIVAALAVGFTSEHLGLTVIFGATLVGLALPPRGASAWDGAIESTTKLAKPLLPLFFISTGLTVFATGIGTVPWGITAAAVGLGVLGKFGGGYLGGRAGGQSRSDSARIGAMMNTRGLTEMIILQAGHQAGILTTGLFLALLLMALATTALTGPLLALLDRTEVRRPRIAGELHKAGQGD
ncbi:cation:proton antiporter [Amycolatopsis sp. WQ 127309]|uniref:cation:proton antiporter n=1 Tax=Amycolatopsis sp. WQ 127309 TaxID=2932773 RepID=UPI001FF0F52F|nr:cation:proton antiporter [Amycolatopsis sp. WQ 127309]UOZ06910.1 cation:proton antiporter [Amycolatopsis sp. WQ 127309]